MKRNGTLLLLTSLFLFGPLAAPRHPAAAQTPTNHAELARKTKAFFEASCFVCHGKDGRDEGGMNYILNRAQLVERSVKPSDSANSRVYKRLKNGTMPPRSAEDDKGRKLPRPTDAEIALIKEWIDAGAPDWDAAEAPRAFIASADILRSIEADLRQANERERPYLRYFTITHLFNAGLKDNELQTYRLALAKLVNSVSWGREIVVPKPVDPARTILRIDLRDYEWDERVWDAILAANPYGITYDTELARSCYTMTNSKLPYVRGDWFVFAASRPPLYHRVLQLPTSDRALEAKLGVDVARNIKQERVARAGFNASGVSQNNRLIERHRSPYGAYWKSYDFAGNVGRQNLFEYPLGPGSDAQSFQHDGGEIIFNLPNGLQAYLLVDAKGQRIDKGPTSIVRDDKQGDRAVVNGISCMSCHHQGMIEKPDRIRAHVLASRNGFQKAESDKILALYPSAQELNRLLQEDATRFRNAVKQVGGQLDKQGRVTGADPVVNLAKRFEDELYLSLVAAELGLKPEEFLERLNRSPALARAFGVLRIKGATVKRDQFAARFGDFVRELNLGAISLP